MTVRRQRTSSTLNISSSAQALVPSESSATFAEIQPGLVEKLMALANYDNKTFDEFINATLEEWMSTTGDLLLEFCHNQQNRPAIEDNLIIFAPAPIPPPTPPVPPAQPAQSTAEDSDGSGRAGRKCCIASLKRHYRSRIPTMSTT